MASSAEIDRILSTENLYSTAKSLQNTNELHGQPNKQQKLSRDEKTMAERYSTKQIQIQIQITKLPLLR